MPTRLDRRFFATTRGRIVALLRGAAGTVDELAQTLGVTGNAVRAHLSTLERDGLVEPRGLRRGVSKPAVACRLAEALVAEVVDAPVETCCEVGGDQRPRCCFAIGPASA